MGLISIITNLPKMNTCMVICNVHIKKSSFSNILARLISRFEFGISEATYSLPSECLLNENLKI